MTNDLSNVGRAIRDRPARPHLRERPRHEQEPEASATDDRTSVADASGSCSVARASGYCLRALFSLRASCRALSTRSGPDRSHVILDTAITAAPASERLRM